MFRPKAKGQDLQQSDASRRKVRPRIAMLAGLLFLLSSALAIPTANRAHAVVDTDVCSTADRLALALATCTGTAVITTANEELDLLYTLSPRILSSVSGTDTVTAVSTPSTTSYVDGALYQIKPAATNTAAVTLNINSIGAKALVNKAGTALSAGQLDVNSIYLIRYFQSSDQFRLLTEVGGPFASTSANNNFSANQTLVNGGNSAVASPYLILYRNSISPAAADLMGAIEFDGRNSSATRVTYSRIISGIIDATAASEDGSLAINTLVAGVSADRWYFGDGFYGIGLTDMGANTVNATAYYDSGVDIDTLYVKGPPTSTNTAIATWNGTNGLTLRNTSVTISAAGEFRPAAGTTTVAPIKLTAGVNNTTAQAGAIEYDGDSLYASHAASARGVILSEQFMQLSADYTTVNQTGAQKAFNATANGAFNTVANTTYRLNCFITATGISSSSGTWSFGFGGTASISSTSLHIESNRIAAGTISTAPSSQYVTSVTAVAGTAASTTTAGYFKIEGTIRTGSAGTFIPQTSVSVAAGITIKANSYCGLRAMGSNAVTNVGNWN